MKLVDSIFLRALALLVGGVLLTLVAVTVLLSRHAQTVALREAEAYAVFLAGQSVRPVLLDDRVSLKSLLVASVERGVADYVWLERQGRPLAHTFAVGVPRGLVDLRNGSAPAAVRDWQDGEGREFVDIVAQLPQSPEYAMHLGLSRARLDQYRSDALPIVVAIGVLMLVLGAALARVMAHAVTREADSAARQVVDSERRLRTILELEPECVKLLGADGCLLQMNRAGLAMIEADSAEQVLGHKVSDIVAPADRDAFDRLNERVLAGAADSLQFEIVGLKGGHRMLETQAVPWRNADGDIVGVLGVTRDVTAHRQAELALLAAKDAAEAANRAKSQFLAAMSHEIRTPMNGVLGMAQLLMDGDVDATTRVDYARVIYNSGQSLLAILNEILDFSKLEAGRVDLECIEFAPEAVLREVEALFAESARRKDIELDVAWRGDAAACYRGDPLRLRQVLANLIGNGIKFSAGGRIGVYGEEAGSADGEALLCFYVDDRGMGIPVDRVHLLFQPFSQLDVGTTRRYGGTGLGLAIARGLVGLMGGEIGVESVVGRGSTFWFTARVESVGGDLAPAAAAVASAAAAEGAGRRILVVEDVEVNRRVVETLLRKLGYAVAVVGNGREAVAAATAGRDCDLVLMDCQMPEMDGFEATRQIRRWEQESGSARLPIIALTASVFAEDRERCAAAGMDDFLAKPLDHQQLHAALGKWLGQAG